jgi:hypothetical protein
LGEAQCHLRNEVPSQKAFDKAFKLDPQSELAHLLLGRCFAFGGHDLQARDEFLRAVTVASHPEDSAIELAQLELRAGNTDAARHWLDEVVVAQPTHAIARALLAKMAKKQCDFASTSDAETTGGDSMSGGNPTSALCDQGFRALRLVAKIGTNNEVQTLLHWLQLKCDATDATTLWVLHSLDVESFRDVFVSALHSLSLDVRAYGQREILRLQTLDRVIEFARSDNPLVTFDRALAATKSCAFAQNQVQLDASIACAPFDATTLRVCADRAKTVAPTSVPKLVQQLCAVAETRAEKADCARMRAP